MAVLNGFEPSLRRWRFAPSRASCASYLLLFRAVSFLITPTSSNRRYPKLRQAHGQGARADRSCGGCKRILGSKKRIAGRHFWVNERTGASYCLYRVASVPCIQGPTPLGLGGKNQHNTVATFHCAKRRPLHSSTVLSFSYTFQSLMKNSPPPLSLPPRTAAFFADVFTTPNWRLCICRQLARATSHGPRNENRYPSPLPLHPLSLSPSPPSFTTRNDYRLST